jgi:hypothetical protein
MLTRRLDKLLARQVLPSKRPCRPAAVGSASGAKLALRSPHRGRPTREPHFIRCRDNGLDSNNLTTRQIVRFVKRGQVRFEIIGSFRR